MTDPLPSILTQESWFWDPFHSNEIKFHPDGTGDLLCRYETQTWIMAQFTWTLSQQTTNTSTTQLTLPTTFPITLTLTKCLIPGSHIPPHIRINEALLTDEAFRPKTYTVRLDKGTFITQHDVTYATRKYDAARYFHRLVFDKSPYPPPEEWKEMSASLEAFRVWEWTEFCSRKVDRQLGVVGEMWGG
ncbi:hypothetical protein BO94DRAFT_622184 [Aspergillus sclerotioniger CBS 115572]|uniref:Uncharacterized protein n=1 Tax=Aspergillus sclerotioniger CBS 115572 TaxID=1450535 RepID=A0A317X7U0_9EURO|nr:hypothetical protein BO94DRAFT_622184 [Aspergillus sclerotioniger CBS 115572]PWY92958.1 hypothetical protein BO94DRAFT_622184 [Aspergillus sclerotioniger CBS 115572]